MTTLTQICVQTGRNFALYAAEPGTILLNKSIIDGEQNMMRTAFLEANHWHLRPHLSAIKNSKEVQLVALSGKGMLPTEASDTMGIPLYADYTELLDKEALDFVYVFGTHRQSPSIVKEVVERGMPFITEKPCGVSSEELVPILSEIDRKRVVNSVPFGRRFSPIVERYRDMLCGSARKGQLHFVFRYITGSPQRYVDLGCPWGLDPYEAGGGCLINLGPHYIDLVRYITRDEINSVKAAINRKMFDTQVDDYAALLLTTTNGATATIEVGFSNPAVPYELYCMTGNGFYIAGEPSKGITAYFDNGRTEEFDFQRSDYYDETLENMVLSVKGVEQPRASLKDGYESLKVINAAYDDAQTNL
jgi:predicted dehydrogenase